MKDTKFFDECGRMRGGYFFEDIQEKIRFYLSERASGRNLDIGGGFYPYVDGSVVVDQSLPSLLNNPSPRKVLFDVESARHLPFADASFDSATMVSVLQYLENPGDLLRDFQRVVRPGGTVHIINTERGWIEGYQKRKNDIQGFAYLVESYGYKPWVDTIPRYIDGSDIKSVTFSIGGLVKEPYSPEPEAFLELFALWQYEAIKGKLERFHRYPVTKAYKRWKRRVDRFSEACEEKGLVPLLFFPVTFVPKMKMMEGPFAPITLLYAGEGSPELEKRSGLDFSRTFSGTLDSWPAQVPPDLKGKRDFGPLLSSTPLNAYARAFRAQAMEQPEVARTIREWQAHNLLLTAGRERGHMHIDDLVAQKDMLERSEISHYESLDIPFMDDVLRVLRLRALRPGPA